MPQKRPREEAPAEGEDIHRPHIFQCGPLTLADSLQEVKAMLEEAVDCLGGGELSRLYWCMVLGALQPEPSPGLDPIFDAELRAMVREAAAHDPPSESHKKLDDYLRKHAGTYGRAMLWHKISRLSKDTQSQIAHLNLEFMQVAMRNYTEVRVALDRLPQDELVEAVIDQVKVNIMASMSWAICKIYANRPEGTDPMAEVKELIRKYDLTLWDAGDFAHRAVRRDHRLEVPDSDDLDDEESENGTEDEESENGMDDD